LWPAFQRLLASLALRASLRLLLPLVVASFTKANDAYAAKGETSGILPFALRASLRLFNFVPTKLSMPLPARLESSKRCYWLCQTSGWNEWAGKNRSNLREFWRPAAGCFLLVFGFWFLVFGFARAARYIQYCRRSRCGLNRAYSTPK